MKLTRRVRRRLRFATGIGLVLLLSTVLLAGALWATMQSREDLISLGRLAPEFTVKTSDGKTVRLTDLRGRKRVVLVFYPGDYTPLCTSQLCSFRDSWRALQAEDAIVLGVNPADRDEHRAFARKIDLPFPLIVDARGDIAARYGCRALFGIIKRTVYVVDLHGRVAWVKRGNPPPLEVLLALRGLHDH